MMTADADDVFRSLCLQCVGLRLFHRESKKQKQLDSAR